MSEGVDIRAEVAKLARLIGVERDELEFLEKMSSDTLRELRGQLVELFFDDNNESLRRFAHAGNLLPTSVAASLTKQAVGPVLAARIAGLVEPRQSVAMTARLPIDFVTDITVEIDPRRVEAVIALMPQKIVAQVADELIARREYVTMGQLIGFVDEFTMATTISRAGDEDILLTGFVVEDKSRLSPALELLDDDRLFGLMYTAGEQHLWPEALDLIRHLDEEQFCRIAEQASQLEDEMLDELIEVAHTDELWYVALPAVARMSDPTHAIAALLRAGAAAIKSFADAISDGNDWEDARALLERVHNEQRAELRKRFAKNGRLAQLEPVAELLEP